MSDSATSGTAARQASLPFTISRSLLKLMSIELMMPSYHLILCCPLLLLPSVFPIIRVFSNELALRIKWPKYWNFSFSISPSNEYSGSISFRINWFGLLAVQGTLKSLLQHHSLKTSILWCSAFSQKIQSDSRPDVRIGFRAQLGSNLLYLSIHDAIALPPNSSPTHVLQTQQQKLSPKRIFKPAAKRKQTPDILYHIILTSIAWMLFLCQQVSQQPFCETIQWHLADGKTLDHGERHTS